MRIEATPHARDVLAAVRRDRPASTFTFVFGSGCCEGTAPHLFADYTRTRAHEGVGQIDGVDVLADAHLRRLYGGRTIVVDVEPDTLADGFSAEIPLGFRFTVRSSERSG